MKNLVFVHFWYITFRARSHCEIFSDCDCDSSYRKKWVMQDSMEVFTLCDCDNITNSYVAHYKQKQIAVAIRNQECLSVEGVPSAQHTDRKNIYNWTPKIDF